MQARLTIGCLVSSLSLSAGAIEISPYIVNGTDTTTSEYPSYVRLYNYLEDNSVYNYGFCGGSIIDEYHILTAAHCVDKSDPDIGEVGLLFTAIIPNLDNEDNAESAQKYYVSKFYVHQDYDSDQLINDIAVLKLETPLSVTSSSYIQFASDQNAYRDASESFVAVGHGNTSTGVDSTSVLQKTTLQYVANASCNYYYGGAPSTQLCMAGAISGTTGLENATCQGDSGGPLYWASGLTTYQVGLTSYGPSVCGTSSTSVNATSVFTEVVDFEGWIANVQAGLITADYTTSQSLRDYYLANGNLTTLTTGSSSSGGGLPIWSLLVLGALSLIRKQRG